MTGLYHFVPLNASFSGNNNFPLGGSGLTMLVVILTSDPPTQNYDKGRWGPLTLCVTHPIRSPVLFITIPPSPYYFVPSILSRFISKTPPVTFYFAQPPTPIIFLLHSAIPRLLGAHDRTTANCGTSGSIRLVRRAAQDSCGQHCHCGKHSRPNQRAWTYYRFR